MVPGFKSSDVFTCSVVFGNTIHLVLYDEFTNDKLKMKWAHFTIYMLIHHSLVLILQQLLYHDDHPLQHIVELSSMILLQDPPHYEFVWWKIKLFAFT